MCFTNSMSFTLLDNAFRTFSNKRVLQREVTALPSSEASPGRIKNMKKKSETKQKQRERKKNK